MYKLQVTKQDIYEFKQEIWVNGHETRESL